MCVCAQGGEGGQAKREKREGRVRGGENIDLVYVPAHVHGLADNHLTSSF